MTYYIFKEQIFTIFLSLSHLTAVTFPAKVHDYVGGTRADFTVYELNKKRSLIFEPKRKEIDKNFIVFNQRGKYHFNIKYNENLSNKDIDILQAMPCYSLTLLKETKNYQLFECPRSLKIVNKQKQYLKVNEAIIQDKSYLSKGPPIYVNEKLVYYRGKVL